jgi:hypothetical protein
MQSRTQAHVFHLRTKSYAEHKALRKYYEEIVPLLDSYAESYQGRYGIINGYRTYPLIQDPKKARIYFLKLLKMVDRCKPKDSYLKNIKDSIYQLIYETLYMLHFS